MCEGSSGPSSLESNPRAIDFRELLQRSLIDAADPLSEAPNLGLVSHYPRRDEVSLDPGLVEPELVRWDQRDRLERVLILALLATVVVSGGVLAWIVGVPGQ